MFYFKFSFPSLNFLLAFDVGCLGFEFCVFVAGWRHALQSEWPFIIIIIIYCWTALWHLDTLCYEGCEGHGSANGLPQPRMELAERSHEQTYLGWYS